MSPEMKLLWIYILDNCDSAGLWDINFGLAEFQIGIKLDVGRIKEVFKKQYIEINDNKWFIKDFIEFQYKCSLDNLNPLNKAHLPIIATIKKYNLQAPLKGLQRGFKAPLDKDKEKDKDKDQEKEKDQDKGIKETKTIQDYFYNKYKEVFKKEYIADFGKDGDIFKALLKIIPLDTLKSLINTYLTLPDDFAEKVGYTVGLFRKRINSLQIEKRSLKYGEKGLKAAMASVNWLKNKEVIDVKSD